VVRKATEQEYLSPHNLRQWLRQEKADLAKATELRLKDATEFVTAYGAGQITPQEADQRFREYNRRWYEALPGTHATRSASDAEILAMIDEAKHPDFVERLIAKGRQHRESER
jgi:hypothetical protein